MLPELVLAVGAMALLMVGAYRGPRATGAIITLSILLLIGVAVMVIAMPAGKQVAFGGSSVVDEFARFMKALALLGSAVALLLSLEFLEHQTRRSSNMPF